MGKFGVWVDVDEDGGGATGCCGRGGLGLTVQCYVKWAVVGWECVWYLL